MDLQPTIDKYLESKRKTFPQHTNRISALDDPCLRRLVYMRTHWADRQQTPLGLQGIFETGNVLEPVIGRILSELGEAAKPRWRIIAGQTAVVDDLFKQHQITGTIDGMWQDEIDGKWETRAVVDVKTSNPNVFAGLSDFASLQRYPWTKKYVGQLMLYALGNNIEKCRLVFVNKSNLYEIKLIDFDVDMEYCDLLLQKAKEVNKSVGLSEKVGVPHMPPKINEPGECSTCAWNHICLPELAPTGNLQIVDDEELEELLVRRDELAEAYSEWGEIDKALKAKLVQGQEIQVGSHLITWKQITKNMKASEAKTVEYWQKKILEI